MNLLAILAGQKGVSAGYCIDPRGYLLGKLLGGGSPYAYIDPIDTDKFPVLNGWAKYTVSRATSTTSSGAVATVDTGVRALYPSTCFASSYEGCDNTKSLSAQPDKTVKFGFSTDSYRDRIYIKNTEITPTLEAWNAYLAEHPIDILFPLETSDESVWKPAKDPSGVTGYWDGANGFCAVYGGIPYYGDNLVTDAVIAGAYSNAWISTSYAWTTASGSASFPIPVTEGKRYRIAWDTTDSATVGAVFRYGFTDKNTPSSSNTLSAPRDRTTPQDEQSVEVVASADYLIIQVASGSFPANVSHLSVREMVGYEPPVLLMGAYRPPEPEPDGEEPEPDGEEE